MYSLLKIIKLVFGLFGVEFKGFWIFRIYEDEGMSSVAKFIEGLRVSGFWQKAILGGVLHGGIASAALIFLYVTRGNKFQYGSAELLWLVLANFWIYLGPPLIWYHEKYSQPEFFERAERVMGSEVARLKVKAILFSNIKHHKWIQRPRIVWIVASMVAILYHSDFYQNLGISGPKDGWFYIMFLGVGLLANYTSIGLGRTLTALWAVWEVDKSEPTPRRYHHDSHLGYSFVTDFTAKTTTLFSTGALFFPLIYRVSAGSTAVGRTLPYVMIGIVTALILLSLLLPVIWTRIRISIEKTKLTKESFDILVDKEKEYLTKRTQKSFNAYLYQRTVYAEVMAAKLWLLQSDSVVKFWSYCQIWCLRFFHQAATWLFSISSIPSLNLTPVMTLAK